MRSHFRAAQIAGVLALPFSFETARGAAGIERAPDGTARQTDRQRERDRERGGGYNPGPRCSRIRDTQSIPANRNRAIRSTVRIN